MTVVVNSMKTSHKTAERVPLIGQKHPVKMLAAVQALSADTVGLFHCGLSLFLLVYQLFIYGQTPLAYHLFLSFCVLQQHNAGKNNRVVLHLSPLQEQCRG